MKLVRLLVPFVFITVAAVAQHSTPDAEGFIRDWLVLAPYPIGDSPGGDEIDKKQFATEAAPDAKEGAVQSVAGKEFAWAKIRSPHFYIDFKELHPAQSEHVAAWAVAYLIVTADQPGLTLRMNSNDQGKVYLNGKEVIKFTDTRTLEKENEDSAKDVTLKKGINVLVLKVVNEENNWQGSVRFVDAAGKPFTGFKVATEK